MDTRQVVPGSHVIGIKPERTHKRPPGILDPPQGEQAIAQHVPQFR
jgi:hypothetical protein